MSGSTLSGVALNRSTSSFEPIGSADILNSVDQNRHIPTTLAPFLWLLEKGDSFYYTIRFVVGFLWQLNTFVCNTSRGFPLILVNRDHIGLHSSKMCHSILFCSVLIKFKFGLVALWLFIVIVHYMIFIRFQK